MTSTTPKELLKELVAAAKATEKHIIIDHDKWHDVYVISPIKEFQIENLADWAKMLGKKLIREDWSGNWHCATNHDIIYFKHQGIKFFELVEKEKVE